jgi:magnesium-transporting ATPase (P-type)
MEFKRFSVAGTSYGVIDPRKQEYPPGVTNVNFDDDKFFEHMNNTEHENHENIKRYIECLGLCHTVITEEKTNDKGEKYILYNASSPDELALVNAARHFGFSFKERDDDSNMIIESKLAGTNLKYTLLNVIEFDSARKRMTVIVRCPDGRVMVICKGADSIIEKRLRKGQPNMRESNAFLEEYAN